MALTDSELRQLRAFFFPDIIIDKPRRPARPSLILGLIGVPTQWASALMVVLGILGLLAELLPNISNNPWLMVRNIAASQFPQIYNLRLPLLVGGIILFIAASIFVRWREKRRDDYQNKRNVHEQILNLRKATQELHKEMLKEWRIAEQDVQSRVTWEQAFGLLKKLFREHEKEALEQMNVYAVDTSEPPIVVISPLLRSLKNIPDEQIFAPRSNSEGKVLTPFYEVFIFYPMNKRLAIHTALLNALWGEVVSSLSGSYFYNDILTIQLSVAMPFEVSLPVTKRDKDRAETMNRRIRVKSRMVHIKISGADPLEIHYKHEVSDSERPEAEREQYFSRIEDSEIRRLIQIWENHKALQHPGLGDAALPPNPKSASGSLSAGGDLL
jgi:hypothetical protein